MYSNVLQRIKVTCLNVSCTVYGCSIILRSIPPTDSLGTHPDLGSITPPDSLDTDPEHFLQERLFIDRGSQHDSPQPNYYIGGSTVQ